MRRRQRFAALLPSVCKVLLDRAIRGSLIGSRGMPSGSLNGPEQFSTAGDARFRDRMEHQ